MSMIAPISVNIKSTFVTLETPKMMKRGYSLDSLTRSFSCSESSYSLIPLEFSSPRSAPATPTSEKIPVIPNDCMEDSEKTTVVIKNIPHKYTQEWLLEEIQELGFEVDFLYLPRRMFAKANNIGFGFVNFATASEAQLFAEIFSGRRFPRQPNSMKTAAVGYAKLQGKEANVKHYTERAEQGVISFWVR